MIGIYRIHNKVENKSYIGKSVDIMRRWQEHINQGRTATRYEDEFHFELNRIPENFTFEILLECSESELSTYEEMAMITYDSVKNGYNKINASTEIREDKIIAKTNKDMVSRLNDIVGKPLFVEDKKKLAEFFGYRDKRGNLLGWNTLKKNLARNGFDIIETKRKIDGRMRNCSIISVRYDY